MSSKLFVENLSRTIDNHELERLFATYGMVRNAVVIRAPDTGRSAGYGLVEMGSDVEAAAAVDGLHGCHYWGMPLSVGRAASQTETHSRRPPGDDDAVKLLSSRGPRPGQFGDRGGSGASEQRSRSRD